MADYELFTLPNDIRVIYKRVPNTKIVHCGIMLDVGSRDEREDQQGIAHFWEHMAFKGTKRRNAYHIINALESVGGELNAYTVREKVCFYASVLHHHVEKAIDLISDITFNSIFPEKQIEKERNVILEEMAMYQDHPEDAIQDQLDEVVFAGHQLGKNILGNAESVKSFQRSDFQRFVIENLNSKRIIFSCVGDLPTAKVLRLAQKYLEEKPSFTGGKQRAPFVHFEPQKVEVRRQVVQAHCALGAPSYALGDQNRLPFFLLLNILGGPGMNSRLNMSLREKHGLVYSIDAHYSPYIDTGLMSIFFGTEPSQVDRSLRIIFKEFQRLKTKPLGTLQLHRAKEQLKGQLAMSEENNNSMMLMMAKSMLDLDEIESLESIFARIDQVTSSRLLDIANESLDEKKISVLTFLPN